VEIVSNPKPQMRVSPQATVKMSQSLAVLSPLLAYKQFH